MKTLPLLILALVLAGCGEPAPDAVPGGGGPTSLGLAARAEPFAVGDVVPAFPGLPEGGETVLVFYRGPW